MSTAFVALGSNLGDRKEHLLNALKQLQANGVEVIKVSTFIETEPYGVTDQPGFLNAVCQVETELEPLELLRLLLRIELEMGRVRLRRWGERNIDLDLLLYEDVCLDSEELTLPHPDMQNRDFVLLPLAEIAPEVVHPVLGCTIESLKRCLMIDKQRLFERFKTYVQFETTSDEKATCFPSTAKQLDLARFLVDELKAIGLSDVELTEHGYVLATLPANCNEALPVIGLIAHMDTSSEASGANVQVQLHRGYEGKDIILSEGNVLSSNDFSELLNYVGQDIITSDGTTLLGADDKAGICAIVSACEYLLVHDEVKHGKVRICFTPDEEIGRGTEYFPLESFGADYAYTVDGGEMGELNYETFNACNATIVFNGVSVHPGSAKNKMRNAVTMAAEWQMLLPAGERPEYTEAYEGFYHVLRINGGTDHVEIDMILRDHDKELLAKRKQLVLDLASFMNAKYGAGTVECKLHDCYSNMKEYIMPKYEVVERAEKAMVKANVIPKLVPVRGGTDGARLSEMGLPCPNIFTGGHNFHGRFEYLPLQSLVKATEVVINLIEK